MSRFCVVPRDFFLIILIHNDILNICKFIKFKLCPSFLHCTNASKMHIILNIYYVIYSYSLN